MILSLVSSISWCRLCCTVQRIFGHRLRPCPSFVFCPFLHCWFVLEMSSLLTTVAVISTLSQWAGLSSIFVLFYLWPYLLDLVTVVWTLISYCSTSLLVRDFPLILGTFVILLWNVHAVGLAHFTTLHILFSALQSINLLQRGLYTLLHILPPCLSLLFVRFYLFTDAIFVVHVFCFWSLPCSSQNFGISSMPNIHNVLRGWWFWGVLGNQILNQNSYKAKTQRAQMERV